MCSQNLLILAFSQSDLDILSELSHFLIFFPFLCIHHFASMIFAFYFAFAFNIFNILLYSFLTFALLCILQFSFYNFSFLTSILLLFLLFFQQIVLSHETYFAFNVLVCSVLTFPFFMHCLI